VVVDQRVEARIRRQDLLTKEKPLNLSIVMDEAVLHRVVGGPAIMGAQLRHLVDMTELPNATIQVIPYDVGAHPALESTFYILDFGEAVPSVIYVEGLVGWIYLERTEDIDRYRRVFERLSGIALSPEESVKVMTKIERSIAS
jgi:Domain of unknown function (DUF5753)